MQHLRTLIQSMDFMHHFYPLLSQLSLGHLDIWQQDQLLWRPSHSRSSYLVVIWRQLSYVPMAVMLALSVGVFQITLAAAKAGVHRCRIKEHVILGSTSAAALIIASSQLSKVFGLSKVTLSDLLNISSF